MSYTRDLKVLYQIVLRKFDAPCTFGICNIITGLNARREFSIKEVDALFRHFKAHKPTIFSKFWWYWSYNRRKRLFWWDNNDAGDKQRKKFLQHLIDNL